MDRATVLTGALASVFALAIGGAVGFITTFTHHQYVPWGLVGGLTVIAALLVGFRLVFDSRVIAAAAAVGVIGATLLLTLPGAGGIAFAVADPIGWGWAVGPAVIGAAVVIWPRRSRSRIEAP